MQRSTTHDFSGWTTTQLIVYGAQCATFLDGVTKPSTRKRLHRENAAVLKELGARLTQRTNISYTANIAE